MYVCMYVCMHISYCECNTIPIVQYYNLPSRTPGAPADVDLHLDWMQEFDDCPPKLPKIGGSRLHAGNGQRLPRRPDIWTAVETDIRTRH